VVSVVRFLRCLDEPTKAGSNGELSLYNFGKIGSRCGALTPFRRPFSMLSSGQLGANVAQ